MKYSYKYLEDEWTKGYWNFIDKNALDKQICLWKISSNPNITWDIIKII